MKKRIAVTQRIDIAPVIMERRDCLDQRWTHLLESMGLLLIPVPNTLKDVEAWAVELGVTGIILSGGNDLASLPNPLNPAPERDETERRLLCLASTQGIPLLAVCRGFQLLNETGGGSLCRREGHSGTGHPILHSGHPSRFFGEVQSRHVDSYHNFCIRLQDLAADLVPMFLDPAGLVEGAEHRSLQIAGIMWHPERDETVSPEDVSLIRRIFSL
jgi:putative glutamine amidotransferase